MKTNKRRSRFGIVAIGALVGSVLSVGVATSDVSAKSAKQDQEPIVTEIDNPIYEAFRGGIRW